MRAGEGERVCVTGGSGYIASFIVKLLLHRGYIVHATVRSLKDEKKINHLLALDGANERLHLFKANLLEEGSFDSAINGCVGVFHTASPVIIHVPNPQADLVDPAVKGTLNVLASCAKNPSIKRVVLTSSMGAVLFCGKTLGSEVMVDETWFSAPEFCEKSTMKWYLISKTLAEEAAWKFVKEKGIDMVSINPSVVIGPSLLSTISPSIAFIYSLINGSETYYNATFGWVHVIDVAKAHILAFETPSAKGRYLMTESVAHVSQIVEMLRELYPDFKLPDKCQDDKPFDPGYKVSQEKVRSLGINYIPLKTSLKETVESFKEKHIINI